MKGKELREQIRCVKKTADAHCYFYMQILVITNTGYMVSTKEKFGNRSLQTSVHPILNILQFID